MRSETRIALIYWVIACLWVLLSDVALFTETSAAQFLPSAVKGVGFISLTAVLIYLLMRREFERRERLHQQALAAQTDFRYLFMNNPLPMWVCDLETLRFLDVNETAVINYGYSREEFLNMRISDIRPQEDVPALLEHVKQVKTRSLASAEWRHTKKDGQIIDVDVSLCVITFNGRRASLVLSQDITEQKKARAALTEQDELRLALTKEIELRNVRNRFISMVSHEFRSPLASISTSLDLLDQYHERMTPEKRQERIARMREQMTELTNLLDEVLILMKTDSVGMEFHPEVVDVVALCKGIVEQTRQIDAQEHTFAFTTPTSELCLHGDPKLLRYAVRNLLTNAVKYSPPHSTVLVDLIHEADQVKVRVSDKGIGIPEGDQKRIFDAFYRASNAHDVNGTGLGLAITKQAVDLHGGSLNLESKVGVGTTFTIALPIKPISNHSKPSSSAGAP